MVITQALLTKGARQGRPGTKLTPQGIVVHYVANAGSSAQANRNYFENGSGGNGVSAHYIVGLNGEVLQCIPDNECAMHAGLSHGAAWNEKVKTNNARYIGIECCHPDSTGAFNAKTVASLTALVKQLCVTHKLNAAKDVVRHYDVAGKNCPAYYVKNQSAWDALVKGFAATDVAPSPTPKPQEPSAWAKAAWDWAKTEGILDGTRPLDTMTRQELAQVLYNARGKIC